MGGKGQSLRTVEDTQDEQLRLLWSNEMLQVMLGLVLANSSSGSSSSSNSGSNNAAQQQQHVEAVRAIAALARVVDFSFLIVRPQGGVLKELLKLAVDSSTSPVDGGGRGGGGSERGRGQELKFLAEEALVNLGFEGGSRALEICGNDQGLLLDWWVMERGLEDQKAANDELPFAVEAMMALGGEEGRGREGGGGGREGGGRVGREGGGSVAMGAGQPYQQQQQPYQQQQQQQYMYLQQQQQQQEGGGEEGRKATALLSSPVGLASVERGREGGREGGGGLGGLSGLIKEVANLRLRDLLLMCLTPAGGGRGEGGGEGGVVAVVVVMVGHQKVLSMGLRLTSEG